MGARNLSGVRWIEVRGKSRLFLDFRYTDGGGKRRRFKRIASVQSTEAARAEARRLMQRAAHTGSPEDERTTPTLRTFVEGDFETIAMPKFRPATAKRYRSLLTREIVPRFGAERLDEIEGVDLRAFASDLIRRGVGPKGPCALVRTILRQAVELGALDRFPDMPRGLWRDAKKLPEAPTDCEVTAMLAGAKGWIRVAIALAAFAGLRSGEVRGLEVRDVDLDRDRVHVRHAMSENEAVTPKSGNDRVVPIAPQLRSVLVDAVRNKLPRARIVTTATGRTPNRQAVLSALVALTTRLHLPARSFHQLRHYFCSTLVRRGASVEVVRLLAGHSALAVTQRYVHAAGSELRSAIDKLG
jgi:integrase